MMMDAYLRDIYTSLKFATKRHDEAGCKYGRYPYKVHLLAVLSVAMEFGITDYHVLVAIPLHDTLEDTKTCSHDLEEVFGHAVTALVEAVTNEEIDDQGTPLVGRKEKFVYTYKKIQATPSAILVKLCDRIANVRSCIDALEDIGAHKRNKSFYGMYKKEYGAFRKALYMCDLENIELQTKLWAELDRLMLWE